VPVYRFLIEENPVVHCQNILFASLVTRQRVLLLGGFVF